MIPWGKLLKHCRIEAGLKQKDIADRLYTSQNVISTWESGQAIPRLDRFEEALEMCGYEIGIKKKVETFSPEEVALLIDRYMKEDRSGQ